MGQATLESEGKMVFHLKVVTFNVPVRSFPLGNVLTIENNLEDEQRGSEHYPAEARMVPCFRRDPCFPFCAIENQSFSG